MREHKRVSVSDSTRPCARLRFLYGQVLERPDEVQRIAYARTGRRLPVVLSQEETVGFLSSIASRRHQVLLITIYATGLRISEALGLRGRDIDSSRMVIRVRQGKGKKDRYVPLSPVLLDLLREHWRRERLSDLLFPAMRNPAQPMDCATVQRYVQRRGSGAD